jgi:pilus assembly protein CpaB
MNRRNIVIIAVAILAVGIGLVVYSLLLQPHTPTSPPRNVVVTTAEIPPKTHITADMVSVQQKPTDQVQPDALANPADAVGTIAVNDIPAGVVLTAGQLVRPTPPPTGLVVPNGMRAVTIPVDQVKAVAGLLKVGDHVDIIAIPPRSGTAPPGAYSFLRDITILAVGSAIANAQANSTQQASAQPTPPPIPSTVTLAVTPKQADMLAAADLNSNLRLALRAPTERANSQRPELIIYSNAVVAKAQPTPASAHPGVTVINGDVSQQ